MRQNLRILFLNQVTGRLFRDLAEDVAASAGTCALLTGGREGDGAQKSPLIWLSAPSYQRGSHWKRISSWLAYFFKALWLVFSTPRSALLFVVSNPPFLPMVGWLVRIVRRQRYVVLVYDVYPGLLENLGYIRKNGTIARIWRALNRRCWRKAEMVFTIGKYLEGNIRTTLGAKGFSVPIRVIPNWADSEFVKPIPKEKNPFSQRHGQNDKLTVLYSGNFGDSHDLGTLLTVAAELKTTPRIHFMIIGGGTNWDRVRDQIVEKKLDNVTLLPFQPEDQLPLTLTVGDVAVVTLMAGAEGHSVPSKTYYAMAAGSALLLIASGANEVQDIIEQYKCGVAVCSGDIEGLKKALLRFAEDRDFLTRCRAQARRAVEKEFTRANTQIYARCLERVLQT